MLVTKNTVHAFHYEDTYVKKHLVMLEITPTGLFTVLEQINHGEERYMMLILGYGWGRLRGAGMLDLLWLV